MGAHNELEEIGRLYALGTAEIINPGAGGTFNLSGKTMARVTVTATGTYTLPNAAAGTSLLVCCDDTSVVTLADSGGAVKSFTGTSGTTAALCIATDSNSWSAKVFGPGSNDATNSGIADAGLYTSQTTVEGALQELYSQTQLLFPEITSITTVGAGTLTAAGIVGGVINRSGPTGAYTDTTTTAAAIVGALATYNEPHGSHARWYLVIKNTVAYACTLAGGSGVTLAGQGFVAPNSSGLFLVDVIDVGSGTEAVTITGLGTMPQGTLPVTKFTTSAAASPVTLAAGAITGAEHVYWQNTTDGAVTVNTRTAAQMYGDIPNAHIGMSFKLTIVNRGDNTVTLSAGANVTVTGETTIATTTTRTYVCTFTSATAMTAVSVDKGAIET